MRSHTDLGSAKVSYDEESPRVGGKSYGERLHCGVSEVKQQRLWRNTCERESEVDSEGDRSAAMPPDSVS